MTPSEGFLANLLGLSLRFRVSRWMDGREEETSRAHRYRRSTAKSGRRDDREPSSTCFTLLFGQYLLTEWTIALYYLSSRLRVTVPYVRFPNRRKGGLESPLTDKTRAGDRQRNATQCPAVPYRIVMIPEFYFFPLFLSVNLPSSPSIHLPPTNSTNHNYTHTTS